VRKRRRLLLAGLALLLLGVAGVSLWLAAPKHRITKANIDCIECIEKGMTQEEVEALLRVRPGDYSHRDALFLDLDKVPRTHLRTVDWRSNEAAVRVSFDGDGRVFSVETSLVTHTDESFLGNVRRWLGW
jgi:hypothetical protein